MSRPAYLFVLLLSIALSATGSPAHAAKPVPEAAGRAVALFTYRGKDPSWRVGATVSGVLIGPKQILASAESLRRRAGRLFEDPEATMPDRIIAVIHFANVSAVVSCSIVPAADDAPFRVLEIERADRIKLGPIAAEPIKTAAMTGQDAIAVGMFAPLGLSPQAVSADVVPDPYAARLRLGDTATRLDLKLEVTDVRQAMPQHLEGAGVWEGDKLVGVLMNRGDGWFVVPVDAFETLIPAGDNGPTPPVTPTIPTPPIPTDPTIPTDPPDTPLPTDPPVKPEPPKPVGPPALPTPELDPAMARLIKEIGGKLTIDAGFVDHVGQDQADMAMAMLAGGQPDKALELIEDILFLTRGKLAEQLTYRRALALAVKGHSKEAMAEAQKALLAEDPQTAGRASMLAAAMELTEDGKFDGKPISDPAVLKAAAAAAMGKVHDKYKSKVDIILALDPSAPVAIDRAKTLLYELDSYRYAWPGYFNDLAAPLTKIVGEKPE